ncbi:inositol-3-phosphate synthase [Candidatus Bathyarchaeota archaeon]|nr:inositol-3-phosphate synthase [Candidatus Bathyarchaeota archaeon]MBT4319502.1 inositol-3-phosphate synthase [Candidatus Bathyarchaeota archaeon]MBT4425007.1 inositol-3-phosphate synthase [Candidatus Bathyarchaeota archaeon]MBT6604147.1 inositol-3-phosphate synthase [Candidatus Bathyarchaeota archaeon]MBT7347064.1 inositol-3-phosphate synthase [Candidatus Bathyarchaeota archaeon]
MGEIRIAIAGVGNCASSLLQGIQYYRENGNSLGLLHEKLGGYGIDDIKVVAAFDIDVDKIGKDVSKAIYAKPNKAPKINELEKTGVKVQMGPSPDIAGEITMSEIKKADEETVDITSVLKKANADVLVNLISGGSDKASRLYAEAAVKAGCGFLNATPSGIVNDLSVSSAFKKAGLPVVGDDLMSQMGATAVHIGLLEFLDKRGVKIEESYQLDVGGGGESINTLEKTKESKRIIKTEAVKKHVPYDFELVSGSADFVDFLINGRDSFFYVKGKYFGGSDFVLDMKLSTEDGPNSGAVLVDVIRGLKIAMDKGAGGPLEAVSAYGFKRPPRRYMMQEAYKQFREFTS